MTRTTTLWEIWYIVYAPTYYNWKRLDLVLKYKDQRSKFFKRTALSTMVRLLLCNMQVPWFESAQLCVLSLLKSHIGKSLMYCVHPLFLTIQSFKKWLVNQIKLEDSENTRWQCCMHHNLPFKSRMVIIIIFQLKL